MPPDKNLRIGLRWKFEVVAGPAGFWWWRWVAFDLSGKEFQKSQRAFEALTECVEDARLYGYVEPEER